MSAPLTTRQREILTAIVEQYIETGEPVSSGTLAHVAFDHAMSSATIRNEMASLADAGLLDQPHTSAGRIPSAEGFRLYVAQLKGSPGTAQLAGQAHMRTQLRSQIDSQFAGVAGAQALLECTSQVLAALSSGVGFAIGGSATADVLEHVHFSRLAPNRVLAVVVTRSGLVSDRVLALTRDMGPVELNTASNFLNEQFRGWNIERIRAELARMLDQEQHAYRQLRDAVELWASAIPATASAPVIYIDGVANLLSMPQNRERLRALLAALEEKQRLVELLNAYIDARESTVRVVFDLEEQQPGMAGLVLVAASARVADGASGVVGVLAPRRMQYTRTIDAVGYVAEVFDRLRDPATP
jgi:heat-inducible transcriptional repressor